MKEVILRATVVGDAKSKISSGIAYVVRTEARAEEALRIYTPDSRFLLVDLEDLPATRLPGMPSYFGGAFVRLYAKARYGDSQDSSEFSSFLGTAEVIEREGQRRLSTPRAAYVQAANEMIDYARDLHAVKLQLGIASLGDAATVMSRMAPPDGYKSGHSLGRAIFLWGSFLGECILTEFGGRWFEDPKIGEVVLIPREPLPPAKVFPFPIAERVIQRREVPAAILAWLERVKEARASTEFAPRLVR
jgi:hypothetical protein